MVGILINNVLCRQILLRKHFSYKFAENIVSTKFCFFQAGEAGLLPGISEFGLTFESPIHEVDSSNFAVPVEFGC